MSVHVCVCETHLLGPSLHAFTFACLSVQVCTPAQKAYKATCSHNQITTNATLSEVTAPSHVRAALPVPQLLPGGVVVQGHCLILCLTEFLTDTWLGVGSCQDFHPQALRWSSQQLWDGQRSSLHRDGNQDLRLRSSCFLKSDSVCFLCSFSATGNFSVYIWTVSSYLSTLSTPKGQKCAGQAKLRVWLPHPWPLWLDLHGWVKVDHTSRALLLGGTLCQDLGAHKFWISLLRGMLRLEEEVLT